MAAVRIPINNLKGGGDYAAPIAIGSNKTIANVILDTGSSTLAVKPTVYDPSADKSLKATAFAQDVLYGTGGWCGPVVKTALSLGSGRQAVSIDAYLALTDEQYPHNFGPADGILGLAYNKLNEAFDLTSYLSAQKVRPAVTYPWRFETGTSSVAVQRFATLMSRMPRQDLPPLFTALEEAEIEKNKFAFYTLRSAPSVRSAKPASDPLNNGFFVLGGGEDESDLFTGEFVNVAVVDDLYYNTDLLSVQVAGARKVRARRLPSQFGKTMRSNSIVDSGTNNLALAPDVYSAIVSSLAELDPAFIQQIEAASQGGIATSRLRLDRWPDITFTLKGEHGEPVALTCAASTYWQTDFPKAGLATFWIFNGQMPQSILGLPLMNNYYTVFDRTQDAYGVIRFAPIAPAAPGKGGRR